MTVELGRKQEETGALRTMIIYCIHYTNLCPMIGVLSTLITNSLIFFLSNSTPFVRQETVLA